jgi:hypothetical protein
MWAVLTFWLLLGLPGLAWLQRFDRGSLARGSLSGIARSYLASFALLTPVSVLGYLLHAPLWMMSAAIVCVVAIAVVGLARDRYWLTLFGKPSLAAALCGIWLAFDLWLGARVGSHVQGDAGFHLARIRLIGAYGFNNWDPLLHEHHFEPIYHTNLYHSLIAACAQLTGLDPGAAWIWVWPFAKLLAAAGTYELAVAVLGRRACGYVAAMTCSACLATSSTLAFPNTLSPYALMPFALACAVDALSTPRFRSALWLGVASVVLAQTHLLYALFLGLAVGPVLALRFVDALVRTGQRRRELLAALFALALSLPWFYAPARPKLGQLWAVASDLVSWVSVASAQDKPAPHATERAATRFLHVDPDLVRLDPAPFVDLENPDLHGVLALAVAIVFTRRRQAIALLAIIATMCAWLFVPALCSRLVDLLANWVVLRFTQLFVSAYVALVPATALAIAMLGSSVLRARIGSRASPGDAAARGIRSRLTRHRFFPFLQAALELAGVAAALVYAYGFGNYGAPWTKEATWQAAQVGSAQISADRITRRASFFAANVERGATVMAPLLRDYDIPMHCPCHAFAFRKGRGERDQAGLEVRRAVVEQFYSRNLSGEARLALLRKYGVRYVFSGPRRAVFIAHGLSPHVRALAHDGDDAIITLSP